MNIRKIINLPTKTFLISLLTALLILITAVCFGQTPNYVKLRTIEPSPGAGYFPLSVSGGTLAYSPLSTATRTLFSATSPLFYNFSTGVFTVQPAGVSQDGALSSVDWNTFNNKPPQLNGTGFVVQTGTVTSYDNTSYIPTNTNNTYTLGGINAASSLLFKTAGSTRAILTNTLLNFQTGVNISTPATITGGALITNGGTTSQFLKGDGSLDGTVYSPQLNGTGFVKATGTTISYDNNTYLTATNPVFTGSLTSGATTYTDVNTWSQYTGSSNNYYQSIWQNTNAGNAASTDLTISNNLGTSSTYYGNLGMNSSTYTGTAVFNQPNTVYLTAQNGDLAIGTTSNNAFHVVVNNGTIDAITTSSAGATTITGATTLTGTTTITDANNFIFGATTGTKFGTATTNKLGFWNATPIVQPVATTDLITGLVNVGLRASGTAVPLTTTGAVSFSNTTVTSSLTANTLSVTGTSSLTGTVNTNILNVNGITTIKNNSGIITLREFVGAGAFTSAVYMGTNTATSINTTLAFDGSSTYLNGLANNPLYLSVGGTNLVRISTGFQLYTPFASSSGAVTPFLFTQPNNSGQTASTVIPGFKHTGNIRGWNGGNIAAIQPEVYFSAPTYSATAASTLSIVAGLLVDAPIAGTNVTFTSNYAVLANGNIGLSAAGNGIYVKEGSNASSGTVTLVAGTVTVSNTNITATSRIFLAGNSTTNAGILTKVNSVGTGFTITSTNAADARAIDYFIIQGN